MGRSANKREVRRCGAPKIPPGIGLAEIRFARESVRLRRINKRWLPKCSAKSEPCEAETGQSLGVTPSRSGFVCPTPCWALQRLLGDPRRHMPNPYAPAQLHNCIAALM